MTAMPMPSPGANAQQIFGYVGGFIGGLGLTATIVENCGQISNDYAAGKVAQTAGRIIQMIPLAMTFGIRIDLNAGQGAAIATTTAILLTPAVTAILRSCLNLDQGKNAIAFAEQVIVVAAKLFNIVTAVLFITPSLGIPCLTLEILTGVGIGLLLSIFNFSLYILGEPE